MRVPPRLLDRVRLTLNAGDMASPAVGEGAAHPLLTFGRVDRVLVQVGYRARPDGPAYEHFLLDLPVPEPGSDDVLDEQRLLAALEPVLDAGAEARRHYSLHQHRWHTSWGPSPGVLEIGLLVTTGTRTATVSQASFEGVTRAFRDLLELVGRPEPTPTSRDAAMLLARRGVATAYGGDPEALSVSREGHHPAENSWAIGLRAAAGDEYDVLVGLVDGYAGSVRVRHDERTEVFDSVGSE